ncbi:MAG: bifunctional DNA-formamidopyrimidine glycosylase/DNA-(apurinic or apyrimidinic site) lyase [Oleiphilaceae bacterium]|nr:bifunctional DNA-formamidopyrimidine glycosylase/DNA-(apurinic or apyrimidinic site) lyase [Oleiphilaceae bacterium]
MPELPEVETTRQGIAPHMEGRRIEKITVRDRRLRWPIPEDLPGRMTGQQVLAVDRRGKYLLFRFPQGSAIVHLGMSGSLRLITDQSPPLRHDHVEVILDQGTTLRYNDPRRFGCWLWAEDPYQHPLLASLGPEPLDTTFSGPYLHRLSQGKTTPVKHFLMDSRTVVGVGNIYANEALFKAGIHPRRSAGRISRDRYTLLAQAIRETLSAAILMGGTTLRDFINSDGKPGYFSQSLQVYGRGGAPCHQCAAQLKEIRMSQRTTVYCGQCQR